MLLAWIAAGRTRCATHLRRCRCRTGAPIAYVSRRLGYKDAENLVDALDDKAATPRRRPLAPSTTIRKRR
jgi:hypothetical protein